MPIKHVLAESVPDQVLQVLKGTGSDMRIARVRRRLTQAEVAARLGVDRRTVAAMEAGAPRSTLAVMVGALWLYGLQDRLQLVADPNADEVGLAIEARTRPTVARKRGLDNDF